MQSTYAKPIMAITNSPLGADAQTIDRFISHCQVRRHPARVDIFRPGDPASTMYYIVSGSVSIIAGDNNGHELVLGYIGAGEFVGEMGLFVETQQRGVALRTRTVCELAEISYENLQAMLTSQPADAARLLYSIGAQISQRLLHTSRKAGRLAFMDVSARIYGTLLDLCKEPEAMTHPEGMQLRVSRQELARLAGCSREMAGRVLKQLQEDKQIHAHGKTVVVFGAR